MSGAALARREPVAYNLMGLNIIPRDQGGAGMADESGAARPARGSWVLVGLAWVVVGVPLLWGIWTTLKKAMVLFR